MRMKACPVMFHQGSGGLVKANAGERREHAEPPPPASPVSVLPSRVLRQLSHGISVTPTVSGIERFILRSGKTGRKKYQTGRSSEEERSRVGQVGCSHIAANVSVSIHAIATTAHVGQDQWCNLDVVPIIVANC